MSPVSSPTIRWGILATGRIAHSFASDLALVEGNELVAVGSRSTDSARQFSEQYSTPERAVHAHGDYADLAADPDVDVVYVASPHGRHEADAMLCLEAGKAVLCEKPLTLDTSSSGHLIEEAHRRGLFFAEAMWMRANPNIRAAVAMAHDGACGRIAQVRAELGMVADPDVDRMWEPALGASALLDVGIYPLTFAHLVLGEPDAVVAAGTMHERGFDVSGGAVLTYPGGAVADVAWTQVAHSDNRASIAGDVGRIEIAPRFHEGRSFTLASGGSVHEFADPVTGRGYAHEIEEVAACLRAGRTTSDVLPPDGTLAVMRVMDEIRSQLGVSYT